MHQHFNEITVTTPGPVRNFEQANHVRYDGKARHPARKKGSEGSGLRVLGPRNITSSRNNPFRTNQLSLSGPNKKTMHKIEKYNWRNWKIVLRATPLTPLHSPQFHFRPAPKLPPTCCPHLGAKYICAAIYPPDLKPRKIFVSQIYSEWKPYIGKRQYMNLSRENR